MSYLQRRVDIRTELKCEMELQNEHSEKTALVKIIESDEIVGHVPEFLAQVLAPMMRSGETASVDAVYMGKPRDASEGIWVLQGGDEVPYIYQIYDYKKKKKNIRKAIRDAAL